MYEQFKGAFEKAYIPVCTAYETLCNARNMFANLCRSIQASTAIVLILSKASAVDWEVK